MDHGLPDIRRRIAAAGRLTILTGAGVSAASGVPTFRGPGGLWRNRQAQQLATPEAFAQDPALVWEWYAWRRQVIAGCSPNPAHDAIARWSKRPGFTLITQNVDGLHERAGTLNVVRYHGSIWRLRCVAAAAEHAGLAGGRSAAEYAEYAGLAADTNLSAAEHAEYARLAAEDDRAVAEHAKSDANRPTGGQSPLGHSEAVEWDDLRVPLEPLPPKCPTCGALARPAVVWFGEPIPSAALRAAEAATACDVFLSVGTSTVVYPAAGLLQVAKARGAYTVEINPEPTGSDVDAAISLPAEVALPLVSSP